MMVLNDCSSTIQPRARLCVFTLHQTCITLATDHTTLSSFFWNNKTDHKDDSCICILITKWTALFLAVNTGLLLSKFWQEQHLLSFLYRDLSYLRKMFFANIFNQIQYIYLIFVHQIRFV